MALNAAWLAAHKAPVALAGAVSGAAVLGLRARKKAGASGAADAGASGASGQTIAYDSSGFDTYDALEGMIENLQGQISSLKSASVHVPAPAHKTTHRPPTKRKKATKRKRATMPLPHRPAPVHRTRKITDPPQGRVGSPPVVFRPHDPPRVVERRRIPRPTFPKRRQGTANSPTGRIY